MDVEIVWRDEEEKELRQTVSLVPEEQCYFKNPDTLGLVFLDEPSLDGLDKERFILFRDEDGIFGIKVGWIISMKEV